MTEDEKERALQVVVAILEEDFGGEPDCGKHEHVTLSCVSCQAAIVKSWLIDASDLYYGTQIKWKKDNNE